MFEPTVFPQFNEVYSVSTIRVIIDNFSILVYIGPYFQNRGTARPNLLLRRIRRGKKQGDSVIYYGHSTVALGCVDVALPAGSEEIKGYCSR